MITKEQIEAAQKDWADFLIQLGKLSDDCTELEKLAESGINKLYNYDNGKVLFKPTRAASKQFRLTKAGALSYFLGGDTDFPEDTGFALQPWTNVKFENADLILEENRAIAMGNYFFTDPQNNKVKVEYTFGYVKDDSGKLKIDLHHSSLPFSGAS